jgi:peptidoglycan hydrolase-like protein with peptidoglycan-binding domain
VSGSGWFRKQPKLLATGGTSAGKRFWQRTKGTGVPRPTKKRGAALTASSAVLVLGAGVTIVAFASPRSHASLVSSTAPVTAHKPLQPAADLQLVSVSPAAGARGVNGASPIRVQFSAPLAMSSPMPTLSPSIPGNWTVQGDTAVFTPTVGYFENTRVTVKIPGGLAGMISAGGANAGNGGTLGSNVSQSFTTGSFSTMRLQQLLAQLGYLPMTWTPKPHTAISPTNARAELAAAYSAPAGTFKWQAWYPWNLTSQWKAGSYNVLDNGAVRAFESVTGLTMDGSAGHTVWTDLLKAVVKGKHNPNGYTYALASQNSPENLRIWHNGRLVLQTPVNTGIAASPTADGTFPVYLKYYFSYMKGTNPDGSKYNDPVYYASYFNGGDAVHQFDRGSYGWYQSLGCVELPWAAAKTAYPYLTYGSLVTVTGPVA